MKLKCKYCESYISDTDEMCPNCGAVNSELKRVGNDVPTTIEELKQWYVDHNLPDEETTRFFIGKNYEGKKAFGIYYDEATKNYIVYKNKADGTRAIRYEGKDENYAVNELYLKLKEEIQNQKQNQNNSRIEYNKNVATPLFGVHILLVFVFFIFFMRFSPISAIFLFLSVNPTCFIIFPILDKMSDRIKAKKIDTMWHLLSILIAIILLVFPISKNAYNHRNDAYYKNNGIIYYNYGDDWYYYSDDTWNPYYDDTSSFEYLDDNYSEKYNASDFEESDYYESYYSNNSSSSSSDWDSDSSWDSSDSWDSGGSDWDSDW